MIDAKISVKVKDNKRKKEEKKSRTSMKRNTLALKKLKKER